MVKVTIGSIYVVIAWDKQGYFYAHAFKMISTECQKVATDLRSPVVLMTFIFPPNEYQWWAGTWSLFLTN